MSTPAKTSLGSRLELRPHPASHAHRAEDGRVQCRLCPRHCTLSEGRSGFCKVRRNDAGRLVTLNYGVSVECTQEVIETEAVFHYLPGEPILSLGNIGCMFHCDFCQNWTTSQADRVQAEDMRRYTPEEIVETALAKGIRMLSWTYNDPVVWHEFVMDTARLAQQHGIQNLYKSAFYISPAAVDELREVIDVFSISLKSMDPEFYRKITKGKLEPVLDAIRQVHSFGDRHLEISNLVIPEANDSLFEVERLAGWVLSELDASVPLHFVRFHPAYRYTHVDRTSIPFLVKARERALEMGIEHCYLGNVFEDGAATRTDCRECGAELVTRFGLNARAVGIDANGQCETCGAASGITCSPRAESPVDAPAHATKSTLVHRWDKAADAGHVSLANESDRVRTVTVTPQCASAHPRTIRLKPGERWRFLVARDDPSERGFEVRLPEGVEARFLPVLDRAHFPTRSEAEAAR